MKTVYDLIRGIIVLGLIGASLYCGSYLFAPKAAEWLRPTPPQETIMMTMAEAEKALNCKILLPTPTEIQERINKTLAAARRPLLEVDGHIGPKTIDAYEVYVIIEYGKYHCEKAGME